MRPLRLKVRGFTSFRDEQELDFSALDVFAISGPTGSGKSSLLDAMTYALYGRVERVGDRVSQLVSQGQPRMAVTLEFEVGAERYRVARSTPASRGSTKIQLERLVDGEWTQAGEGSDRVRDAEQAITAAIGLTYDGFTRSVLLPQGRFQEFLVGDPRKRREILTELLGLSLFRRMAERANALARDAQVAAQAKAESLEREYAGVTPEAVEDSRRAAGEAAEREGRLAEAAERMVEILGRWEQGKRSIDELRACAAEAGAAAETAAETSRALATLVEELERVSARADQAAAAAAEADALLAGARAKLQDADASGRSTADLARAQVLAHALADAMTARERLGYDLEECERTSAEAAAEIEGADAALRERAAERSTAEEALRTAEAALEEARHADLVATVAAGLRAGDPCPVCGVALERAPARPAAAALRRAIASRDAAARVADAARSAEVEAERRAERARREAEVVARERGRVEAALRELSERLDSARAAIEPWFPEGVPADPATTIADWLASTRALEAAERQAAERATAADRALAGARAERDRGLARLEVLRDRLATDHRSLFERAARAAGRTAGAGVKLPAPPDADGAAAPALRAHAEKLAAALSAFAERLEREVDRRASTERDLLEEAATVAPDLSPAQPSLEAYARAVESACRSATADAATARQRADDLAERLERRDALATEIASLESRSRVFKALALELRADRLIAFLQAEALQLLSIAASERLGGLSDGRYRLTCRDDEFFVVDTWNGDDERSVRTLSGGETFLASLSLALALADQVRSLSVTDRARLDSLFLDEGFGTLDQDALRVVVDAIEQLGGDGRMVGVITHVRELAEQFPRVEVEKSPRGSRLALAS